MSWQYLCIFDITHRSLLDEISGIHELILRVMDEDKVPMVLVGNKCDLEEERKVTTTEGQHLSDFFDFLITKPLRRRGPTFNLYLVPL
mmetsp:Transcript_1670/g.2105  ORF Transcript_1670/g.2105 Transcript_1670/m.2105 type:complete len:88 (+) Transcript_1670:200-463(+)